MFKSESPAVSSPLPPPLPGVPARALPRNAGPRGVPPPRLSFSGIMKSCVKLGWIMKVMTVMNL
jgi:hypothetical protein